MLIRRSVAPRVWLAFIVVAASLFPGCRGRMRTHEVVYVSAQQAFLRDQVAAIYAKVTTVKNGDRLEIIDRDRRFAKVRTAAGLEGWIEQRNIVTQKVYDGFQQLAADTKQAPSQATGIARNDTNLHLTPGRDTDHLYQLVYGAKVSLLKRDTAERAPAGAGAPRPASADPAAPPRPLEDWWLVRDEKGHAGWVLGRMIDIDVPIEVAQYAEGQRIVAAFVLNRVLDRVEDEEKQVAQYLLVLTENKDGLPYDYNQARIFTWNVRKHRYETAYRERNLNGTLPVSVSNENFDKEGNLPVFVLRVKDDAGNVSERKYKLNTPLVHRVLAAGEQPPPRPASSAKRASTARKRRSRR